MTDRIDDLLEQAIATGHVPAQATAAERAELEALLAEMGVLRAARGEAETEAQLTLPTARARFQRHIAAETRRPAPLDATSQPRLLPWARRLSRGATLTWAGSAVGIAALALFGVLVWQFTLSSPSSAYARVVDPGDYVQVEGVIGDTGDGVLSLKSELGDVEVEVAESTTVVDETAAAADVSALKPGDRLLVGGIAGEGRKLVAQTLALSGADGAPPPKVISFRQLERLRPNLEGRVVTYTISSDGMHGAVLIDAGDGERFLVRVDGASAAQLLKRTSTALGQRVKVQEGTGGTSGTFTLEAASSPDLDPTAAPGERARPAFSSVKGVITNVALRPATADSGRILEGVVTVLTNRGLATVVVRPTTRIFPGDSGLTPGAGLRGEANGHGISISGGTNANGEVVADVIVLGPKVERPATAR